MYVMVNTIVVFMVITILLLVVVSCEKREKRKEKSQMTDFVHKYLAGYVRTYTTYVRVVWYARTNTKRTYNVQTDKTVRWEKNSGGKRK